MPNFGASILITKCGGAGGILVCFLSVWEKLTNLGAKRTVPPFMPPHWLARELRKHLVADDAHPFLPGRSFADSQSFDCLPLHSRRICSTDATRPFGTLAIGFSLPKRGAGAGWITPSSLK